VVVPADGGFVVEQTAYLCNVIVGAVQDAGTGTGSAGASGAEAGTDAPIPPGGVVCPGSSTLQGVDVSSFQGIVDWAAFNAGGGSFAIAKASDGSSFDTRFATNWPGMQAAHLLRGAYHTFEPTQDPVAQANHFLAVLNASGGLADGDLPPALDLESVGGVTDAAFQASVQAWLATVQSALGRRPMIYGAPSVLAHLGTAFGAYPLWLANYSASCPKVPAGWATWEFWQTSATGTAPGITGSVDIDEFNGSPTDLMNLF
jgi:lysozyme